MSFLSYASQECLSNLCSVVVSPVYASSVLSAGLAFFGISANMAELLLDSKFLELVFLKRVCGLELRRCEAGLSLS